MKLPRRFIIAIIAVVIAAIIGAIIYSVTIPPAPPTARELKIFGGIVGGGGYMQSIAFYQAIVSQGIDVKVSIVGTAGYIANAKLLHAGKGDLGVILASDALDILHQRGMFSTKGTPVLQIYTINPPMYLHILVPKDSDMKIFSDLNGKRINLLTKGSLTEKLGSKILDALGIIPSKIVHYEHADAAAALRAGDIDAVLASGLAVPYKELSYTMPLRALSLAPEEVETLRKKLPEISIEEFDFSEYYPGAGVATVPAPWTVMAARYDLDEDLVYELTKALFKNMDVVAKVYKPAAGTKPELVKKSGVPIHPGALKYYQEIGIKIPPELFPPKELLKR